MEGQEDGVGDEGEGGGGGERGGGRGGEQWGGRGNTYHGSLRSSARHPGDPCWPPGPSGAVYPGGPGSPWRRGQGWGEKGHLPQPPPLVLPLEPSLPLPTSSRCIQTQAHKGHFHWREPATSPLGQPPAQACFRVTETMRATFRVCGQLHPAPTPSPTSRSFQ